MKTAIVILVALGVAAPSMAAPEKFVTDKASPLRRVEAGKGEATIVRFTGAVAISGRFLVAWENVDQKRSHLRVVFKPDEYGAALLPHPVGAGAVTDLLLSNSEEAATMLLTPETAQKILAMELLSVEGEARVTIRDYQAVVDCDHRWYMARVVSAVQNREVAAGLREDTRLGC